MLKRRDILASGMVLPAAAAAAIPRSTSDNPLVGTWSLIEATTVNAEGASGPWLGREMSKGIIIYDASGTVSVQIASARNSVSARLRTHCGSQKMMVAAMQMADMKVCAHRS